MSTARDPMFNADSVPYRVQWSRFGCLITGNKRASLSRTTFIPICTIAEQTSLSWMGIRHGSGTGITGILQIKRAEQTTQAWYGCHKGKMPWLRFRGKLFTAINRERLLTG